MHYQPASAGFFFVCQRPLLCQSCANDFSSLAHPYKLVSISILSYIVPMFQRFTFYYTYTREERRENRGFLWHLWHSLSQIRYHNHFAGCAKAVPKKNQSLAQAM